jgi:hypothetical protein
MNHHKQNRSMWPIGGMLMVGVGIGIAFIKVSPLIMVGAIIAGIGLGLTITAIISK